VRGGGGSGIKWSIAAGENSYTDTTATSAVVTDLHVT